MCTVKMTSSKLLEVSLYLTFYSAFKLYSKPVARIELATSPLPRVCSTTEPHGRGWAGLDLNQRRRSQRIYSPPPLTTRAPTHLVPRLLMIAQLICDLKELIRVSFAFVGKLRTAPALRVAVASQQVGTAGKVAFIIDIADQLFQNVFQRD